MNTRYLSLEEILIIHEDQIEKYGGSFGIRDLNLLESAIYRPQSSFGGKDLYKTVFNKAAALLHSLISNHPFVDGNKRTAIFSCIVFLELNGYELNVRQKELVNFVLKVANGKLELSEISSYLKKNSQKL